MVKERKHIQIPGEMVEKLREIEDIRPDIKGYIVSKQVNILLQERIAQIMQHKLNKTEQKELHNAPLMYVRTKKGNPSNFSQNLEKSHIFFA